MSVSAESPAGATASRDRLSERHLLALISALNRDDGVDGILVQLPLPDQIRPAAVAEAGSVELM